MIKPEAVSQLLQSLPNQPGVYRMYNADQTIIYIGKARRLSQRVKQYFATSSLQDAKTAIMVPKIARVEYTVTETESDALLLEATLIKKYRPKYNILLRDDKSYAYLFVSDHPIPRLDFIRSPKKTAPKGRYFGPYPSLGSAKEALVILEKCFKLRNCSDSFFSHRTRPCLQYQINRCCAPCVSYISVADYHKNVKQLLDFLSGKTSAVLQDITQAMQQAAAAHDYELAAKKRDEIVALRRLQAQQLISQQKEDCDAFALQIVGSKACVAVIYVRQGEVIACKYHTLDLPQALTLDICMQQFLLQTYIDGTPADQMPPTLLVPCEPAEDKLIQRCLSEYAAKAIKIRKHCTSVQKHYLQMAKRNLMDYISQNNRRKDQIQQKLLALSDALGLKESIKCIECFDVSHTQGKHARAACVVYNETGHDKKAYRLFSMNNITPGDDVAGIHQAVYRRYKRMKKEKQTLPDVLLIDGGKAQLNSAKKALIELAIDSMTLIGISKGKARKAGMERLYLEDDQLLQMHAYDQAFHLLQAVRDEAHRFSLKAHRAKRQKHSLQSVLENIEGIGPKKRQALLEHFGGLKLIKQASITELVRVPGINQIAAERIRAYFLEHTSL